MVAPSQRETPLSPRRRTDPTLDSLIADITVDCYDEAEELAAFENAFDEDATFPCPGTLIGESVEVLSVSTKPHRRELIATCRHGGHRYDVALLDIDLDADPIRHACSPRIDIGSVTESSVDISHPSRYDTNTRSIQVVLGSDVGPGDGPSGMGAGMGVRAELEKVDAALAAVVGGSDPPVWSGADAAVLVEVFARIERRAAAGKALAARRVADTGVWAASGERSAAHWLARRAGSTVGAAAAAIETAERLEVLPATGEALWRTVVGGPGPGDRFGRRRSPRAGGGVAGPGGLGLGAGVASGVPGGGGRRRRR